MIRSIGVIMLFVVYFMCGLFLPDALEGVDREREIQVCHLMDTMNLNGFYLF